MGYSLGSVPSIHISSNRNIKCLILIAPLASGIKTLIKDISISTNELQKIDIFCNLSKIIDISCPIMLIHGKSDEIINVNHSYEMLRKIKNPNIWFPTRGTHGNIFTEYRKKFFDKLNTFFDKVIIFHSQKTYEELVDTNDLYFEKYELKNKNLNDLNSGIGLYKKNINNNGSGLLRLFNSNFGDNNNVDLRNFKNLNRQENYLCKEEKENNRNTFGYNEEAVKHMREATLLDKGKYNIKIK